MTKGATEKAMAKQAAVVKNGEGEVLPVLGTTVRFLVEAAQTENRFSIMQVELPRDQGPPPHDHPWDEAYYILDGDVWFMVDGEEGVYTTGDFLYAPAGTPHSFRGAGDTPARVIVFDAPSTIGGFFRETSREVVNPEDFAKIPAIGAKYDLNFYPPKD